MNRVPVKSSFIESIGYEKGIVEAVFKDGKIWRFIGVPPDLPPLVMEAESIGKAFREHIIGGGFGVEKVEEKEKVD